MEPHPQVIVIGCGPGGSTAATFLAKSGYRVVVLEKEVFPRFHVGESLLPYNRRLFEEMGVWPALAEAGFPRKFGAQFHLVNGGKCRRFVFRQGAFTRQSEAIQVERAVFDHLLMQHARQCGAVVHEGWTVNSVTSAAEGVDVVATTPGGEAHQLRTGFVIDASGRGNLTGNQQGLRVIHPRHRKLAVFGHFTGVSLDSGEGRGDTVIVRAENRWFWVIPISDSKTSVGLVLDKTDLAGGGGEGEAVFRVAVAASPVMRSRLLNARLVGEIHTTTDFSYMNRSLAGSRVVRVGDAAGFMDPIFSSGVYLAMWSARLAAEVIGEAIESKHDGSRGFARYERRLRSAFKRYWRLIEGFYTTPFMELFLEPRHRLDVPAAVLAVLAGELEGGWRVRWRLELFYLLVRMQARFALVPRICFGRNRPDAQRGEL